MGRDQRGYGKLLSAFVLLGMAASLSGCISTVVGAAASGGVAASQERGFSQGVSDNRISLEISATLLDNSLDLYRKISVDVHEGRVLLTGSVAKPADQIEAIQRVWKIDGVREVINEIKVGDGPSTGRSIRDGLISSEIRSNITLDPKILSINYTIQTEDGVVYLMGIAQNEAELQRVIAYAKNIRYVTNVVSLVRLKTETLPDQRPPAAAQPSAPKS